MGVVVQAGSGTQGVGGLPKAEGTEWKESIYEPLVRFWGRKGTTNEVGRVTSSRGPSWVMNTRGLGLAKCTWNK